MRLRLSTLALLIACAAQHASAAEYVCHVTMNMPGGAGTLGTNGAVSMTTYTGAFCTGTKVDIRYFCGFNNTSASCATGVQLSDTALASAFSNAQNASTNGIAVSFQVAECKVTGLYKCVNNFTIYSP